MMVAATRQQNTARRLVFEIKESSYDRVSSLLWALVFCLATIFVVLLAIWMGGMPRPTAMGAILQWQPIGQLGNDESHGAAADFQQPSDLELEELREPQVEDAVGAITEVVHSIREDLDTQTRNSGASELGREFGDGRGTGPAGRQQDGDRPAERWEVRYSTASQRAYARQLDFFGIELGAISRNSPDIHYLTRITDDTPIVRVGTKDEEGRVFFHYRPSKLLDWDKEFFASSGVDLGPEDSSSILVQFYPDAVRALLLEIESHQLEGKPVEDIKRTIFGVRATEDGFEYYIIDIKFKN